MGGNDVKRIRSSCGPEPFIGCEKVKLFQHGVGFSPAAGKHGAAGGAAKLVLLVGGHSRLEVVPGVQGAIAKEFPHIPVVLLRAAPGYDIDNAAQGAAICGTVVVRLNFEFLDVVDNGGNRVIPDKPVIRKTVEQKHIAAIALSVHRWEGERANGAAREIIAAAAILAGADGRDAWRQSQQLGEVAPIKGRLLTSFCSMAVPSSVVVVSTVASVVCTVTCCVAVPTTSWTSFVSV